MKKTEFITRIIEYILLALGAILVVAGFTNTAADAMRDGSATDLAIWYCSALLLVGGVAAVISWVIAIASNTKGLIGLVIGVAAFVIFTSIFWAIGSDTPLPLIGYEGDQNEGAWLKIADVGIYWAYLAFATAGVSIVASEVIRIFR